MGTKGNTKVLRAIEPDRPLSFIFNFLGKKCKGSLKRSLRSDVLERFPNALQLICREEKITQQCLVKSLEIDKAMVVRVIDFLSENKLVSRSVNPEDRREHLIIPTAKALKMLPKIEQAFAATDALALRGFSPSEIKKFKAMLRRVHLNLVDVPLLNK